MNHPILGNLAGLDVEGMLRRAQESQRRLAEVQAQREELRVVGRSPDGLLEATVDGTGRIVDLRIEPRAMRLDSYSLAEGLLAAVKDAYTEYDAAAQALVGEATGDPELFAKIRSGEFDAYEYLRGFGLNLPEARGELR